MDKLLIAKCPNCGAEMEGDVVVGDYVECPICQTKFYLELRHVVPETTITPSVQTVPRETVDNSYKSHSSINAYLSDKRPSRRHEHLPAVCLLVFLLAAVAVGVAWKADVPWIKNIGHVRSAGGSHAKHSSSQYVGKPSGNNSRKRKKRELTAAEKVFKEALDALLGQNGGKRDIVKARQGFEKAKDMGYELAHVALAHIDWNMTDEDKKAFKEAGMKPPDKLFYSVYPNYNIFPAWVAHSRVAKFEQGMYQMRLSGRERNMEGLQFVLQAAQEGLAPAQGFLKSTIATSLNEGLDVSEALLITQKILWHNPDIVSSYQHLCDVELAEEFYLSVGIDTGKK
jgi:hypothetical protein